MNSVTRGRALRIVRTLAAGKTGHLFFVLFLDRSPSYICIFSQRSARVVLVFTTVSEGDLRCRLFCVYRIGPIPESGHLAIY